MRNVTKAIFCTILDESSNQLGFIGLLQQIFQQTIRFRFRLFLDETTFLSFTVVSKRLVSIFFFI